MGERSGPIGRTLMRLVALTHPSKLAIFIDEGRPTARRGTFLKKSSFFHFLQGAPERDRLWLAAPAQPACRASLHDGLQAVLIP
jgi:hypothetical protein